MDSSKTKSKIKMKLFLLNRYEIKMNESDAFFKACERGDVEQVRRQLRDGRVKPHIEDLVMASEHGHTEIVCLLLADPRCDPTDNENQAIQSACQMGHLEVVRLLLADRRVDPSSSIDGDSCIDLASENGHLEIVRLLLADSRVDPSDNENAAIISASEFGHVEVVRLLLVDTRVNPADKNNEAIRLACQNCHSGAQIVRLLLADQRVNPKGEEGIYISRKAGRYIIEIAIIDDVICYVKNGDVNSIRDEAIREKFVKWQYRIGGEKWIQAKQNLQ